MSKSLAIASRPFGDKVISHTGVALEMSAPDRVVLTDALKHVIELAVHNAHGISPTDEVAIELAEELVAAMENA